MVSSSPAGTLSPQKATGVFADMVMASGEWRSAGGGKRRGRREKGSIEGESVCEGGKWAGWRNFFLASNFLFAKISRANGLRH